MSLTVTSSSRSTNALPPFLSSRACAGGATAGDGARGEHAVGERVGHEARGGLVVARLRAALEQQRRRRDRAAGDAQEVAVELAHAAAGRARRVDLGERDAGERLAPVRADDGRALVDLDAEL